MSSAKWDVGAAPATGFMDLSRNSDYSDVRRLYGPTGALVDWPTSTTLKYVFPLDGTEWTATISGASATWAVDKAQTNTRENAEEVNLYYINGTDDLMIWKGRVRRND